MSRLLLASNNPGKLKEIQALLGDLNLELCTPAQIDLVLDIKETGQTYAENAALKGLAYARAAKMLTLADDSGLEVDALNGLPGIRSARFAPTPGATDRDRCTYLLKRLSGSPQPWTARFRCIIALVNPSGETHYTEGICPGTIIPDERGENGFGYDPIFLIPELNRTMAELNMAQKNRLSHRALAVQAVRPILSELLKNL
jgi:XTP/dITP diphosphohydrolase